MQKLRKFLMLTFFFVLVTHSVYGQPSNQECENYVDSAYIQGSQVAHWSAYVPIAVFVAAGIFLGIADNNHKSSNSHASYDGLGPLESYSSYSGRYSGSGYGH
jgi:hypothetical protein